MTKQKYKQFEERATKVYDMLECEFDNMKKNVELQEKTSLNTIDSDLESIGDMFAAARRGLGLVNRLSPGESKLRNTKRVMTNLNRIRASLLNLERKIGEILRK